jgi:hypothetical protein
MDSKLDMLGDLMRELDYQSLPRLAPNHLVIHYIRQCSHRSGTVLRNTSADLQKQSTNTLPAKILSLVRYNSKYIAVRLLKISEVEGKEVEKARLCSQDLLNSH